MGVLWIRRNRADLALVAVAEELPLGSQQDISVRHCSLAEAKELSIYNFVYRPGLMNSLAGLISTITNIFGVQHGQLSTTSKSTVVVVTASTAIFAFFTLFYLLWLVRRVKARHDREVGKQRAGKYGEGVVDISTRKI